MQNKIAILSFIFLNCFGITLNAQLYTPSSTISGSSGSTTKVGIGNSAPTTQLEITTNPINDSLRNVFLTLSNSWNGHNSEPSILFTNGSTLATQNDNWYVGAAVAGYDFFRISRKASYSGAVNPGTHEYLRIQANGRVIIGDASTLNSGAPLTGGSYKLYVTGGIRTELAQVDLSSTPWADFVFNKNYKLKSLDEVESFIEKNHHLPEIPSAKEVKDNGINVVEMDAKLLQKIEELTLYMIEMKKENDAIKSELKSLKSSIKK